MVEHLQLPGARARWPSKDLALTHFQAQRPWLAGHMKTSLKKCNQAVEGWSFRLKTLTFPFPPIDPYTFDTLTPAVLR